MPNFSLEDGTFNPNLIASYDYDLPLELIAHTPAQPRDASRLMVVHRGTGRIEHRVFRDLPDYLDVNDLLVANNTRVLHARLPGFRLPPEVKVSPGVSPQGLGGRIELLLLEEVRPGIWEALYHGRARAKPGLKFYFETPDAQGLFGEVVRGSGTSVQGTIDVKFDRDPEKSRAGELPLPPYIERKSGAEGVDDEERYQTVYAQEAGSAAAPTAGLHFTPQLLKTLRTQGVEWREVTLHVGIGTFRPVRAEHLDQHDMHEERWSVSDSVAQELNQMKSQGKRIVAVGTTSVRTLESAWQKEEHQLRSGSGRTKLFIRPGLHQFQAVDRMITNFHLPKSTLLMLVGAFAGIDLVREAYRQAVAEKYRFFSYGDAMLIL
jgi:S-adenosylmethionine:tRNA ribosyltransferase-isomerase